MPNHDGQHLRSALQLLSFRKFKNHSWKVKLNPVPNSQKVLQNLNFWSSITIYIIKNMAKNLFKNPGKNYNFLNSIQSCKVLNCRLQNETWSYFLPNRFLYVGLKLPRSPGSKIPNVCNSHFNNFYVTQVNLICEYTEKLYWSLRICDTEKHMIP